jgi:hypothetical protein
MFKMLINGSSDWEQPYSNGPVISDASPCVNSYYKEIPFPKRYDNSLYTYELYNEQNPIAD